jgi:two-component system, cell cycle response regulator
MTPQDPNDIPAPIDLDDPEAAMRDARQRFIAAFPKRSDSIGLMLSVVATLGPRGPVGPLRQIVHRTSGLAGTLGFPTVSIKARAMEQMLDGVDVGAFEPSCANMLFDELEQAFTDDLANPPEWVGHDASGGGNRRVMVVEDDEDQREVVSINLRAAGYIAIPVPAGDQVFEVARVQHPDLILLDANLPGMDGYTVCRLLKADPELAGVPVIFTTVRSSLDDRMVGLMLGADDYLIKPLDMAELMLRVQILIARRAQKPVALVPAAGLPPDMRDLDYETFTALAREQLGLLPGTLALVKLPEARLIETYSALRSDSRRRDLVACYDPSHIILLMVEMPLAKARERLGDVIARLGPGEPPRFQVGLAYSPGPGAKPFEALLAEADQAAVAARQHGVLLAVAGELLPAAQAVEHLRGTIVLADDDPDVTRLIDAQLRSASYLTILAADGAAAITAIDEHHPDLVIVDMMMPRMTGFDVLSAVRQRTVRPRVLVLSARGREQDITRAFALGADDYVTKPFSPPELLARMERLLR